MPTPDGAVAGKPGLHGAPGRSILADAGRRAAEPARTFAVGLDAASLHAYRIAQLVELDAVEIAEAEVPDVDGRQPGVGAWRACAPRMHEEQRVDEWPIVVAGITS